MDKKLELFEKILLTFSNVDEFVTDDYGMLTDDFECASSKMLHSMQEDNLTDEQNSLLVSLVGYALTNGSSLYNELGDIFNEYAEYRYEQAAQEYIKTESPYADTEFADEIADIFSDNCLWIASEMPNYRPISFRTLYWDWTGDTTVKEILSEYDALLKEEH